MLVSIPENTAVTKTDTVLAAQSCRHAGKTDDEQAIPRRARAGEECAASLGSADGRPHLSGHDTRAEPSRSMGGRNRC